MSDKKCIALVSGMSELRYEKPLMALAVKSDTVRIPDNSSLRKVIFTLRWSWITIFRFGKSSAARVQILRGTIGGYHKFHVAGKSNCEFK
jgi:hypothetical protein